MIDSLFIIETDSSDPYRNLGLEEFLLNSVEPHQCVLYLWQNAHTVVIGRNQNALDECKVQLLQAEGGHLARRLSGGGAVYHDLGNLNFTFIAPKEDFDVARQTDVILGALQRLGVNAERNGRNDLVIDGKKFSGHAYYRTKTACYHHGTLMVDVDPDSLSRYLNVSLLKLAAKGVSSVRSRVTNLVDHAPSLSILALKDALTASFEEAYGMSSQRLREGDIDAEVLGELERKYASRDWIYDDAIALDNSVEARFDWGCVRIDFSVRDGRISQLLIWSDALEADYLESIPALLQGVAVTREALLDALLDGEGARTSIAMDISKLISTESR